MTGVAQDPVGWTAASDEAGGSAYAGLVTRTLAFATDALVINGVAWLTALVVGLSLSVLEIPESVRNALIAIGAVVALVWSAAYFVFFWSVSGQTPGSRLLEISVRDARTGLPPRPGRAFLRLLGLCLSALLLCVGFLMIAVDSKRRALHDRLVGTVVIYTTHDRITHSG
jgi:uncharacterized RDD family membrane protein YckC